MYEDGMKTTGSFEMFDPPPALFTLLLATRHMGGWYLTRPMRGMAGREDA